MERMCVCVLMLVAKLSERVLQNCYVVFMCVPDLLLQHTSDSIKILRPLHLCDC